MSRSSQILDSLWKETAKLTMTNLSPAIFNSGTRQSKIVQAQSKTFNDLTASIKIKIVTVKD